MKESALPVKMQHPQLGQANVCAALSEVSLTDTIEIKSGSERIVWYANPIGGRAKDFKSAEAALAYAKDLIQENLDLRVKIVAMDWDYIGDVEIMIEIGSCIMERVNFGL